MIIKVIPIPAFTDNYIWALCDEENNHLSIVDPGDAAPVIKFIEKKQFKLLSILVTHHHGDHSGGVAELQTQWQCPVYCSSIDGKKFAGVTHYVAEGDTIEVLPGFLMNVFNIPGHTLGHIAFYNDHLLFCGDTLFAAGCGRLFEGTPAMMYHSLQKLARLPAETKLYCGHEYTLANLRFAKALEPHNQDILKRIDIESEKRGKNQATLPSTISLELRTNPFLRCSEKEIQMAIGSDQNLDLTNLISTFAELRRMKDHFK